MDGPMIVLRHNTPDLPLSYRPQTGRAGLIAVLASQMVLLKSKKNTRAFRRGMNPTL
jgi:hypothetical protein